MRENTTLQLICSICLQFCIVEVTDFILAYVSFLGSGTAKLFNEKPESWLCGLIHLARKTADLLITGKTQQRGLRGGSARVLCLAGNPSKVAPSLTVFWQNSHWRMNQLLTVLTSESPPPWEVQLFVAVPPSGPFLLVLPFQHNLFHMKLIFHLCESPSEPAN